MALWRLLGFLRQPKSAEHARAQSINGWSPWRYVWSPLDEPDIVVPDPKNPSRSWHVGLAEAGPLGSTVKFAAHTSDDIWWFYVPAKEGEQGAFEPETPKCEGFWRARADEESELPWPVSDEGWQARPSFLRCLDLREAIADRIAYRGYSQCRLCGIRNGYEALRLAEWEWPAGFRHYVQEHNVRPSAEFVAFIVSRVELGEEF